MVLLLVYIGWNLVPFILMMLDKGYARRGARRISEQTFLLWGFCFGAAGILLGMHVFRHKTRQRKFSVGMPMLLVLNGMIAYFCYGVLLIRL